MCRITGRGYSSETFRDFAFWPHPIFCCANPPPSPLEVGILLYPTKSCKSLQKALCMLVVVFRCFSTPGRMWDVKSTY